MTMIIIKDDDTKNTSRTEYNSILVYHPSRFRIRILKILLLL